METKYKSKLTIAAIVAMLVAVAAACVLLFYANAHGANAEQAFDWTTSAANGGSWEETEDGGETVYSYKPAGDWNNFGYINNSADFRGNKSISLDVNYKDVTADGGDANHNFVVRVVAENKNSADTSENVFSFLIMRGGAVTARYNDNDIANTGYEFPRGEDKWFTLSIIFNSESGSMYIDDTEVLSFENPDAQNVTLARTKMNMSIWALPVSVKNITVTEKSGYEYSYDSAAFSHTLENGEEVFTHKRSNPDSIAVTAESGTYNTLSADVRLNEEFGASDGNISLSVKLNETDSYGFEYNPAPSRSYARLRYFDAEHSSEGTELGRKEITIAAPAEWVNLKAVYERDYLVFYVDGEKVISVFDTGASDFGNAQGSVSMWMVKGSAKNIKYENTAKDLSDISYVELEFKKPLAAEVFGAQNGDIGWEENFGALQLTVTGANPTLTSPRIDVAEGSMYSMKLPVRNTFVVRLKNDTDADKLTLNYITAVDETYDTVKQKTFDIEPNSDYKTYYFNISDVADCGHWETNDKLKACKHFLRGFKFTFNGATSGDVYIDAVTFEREDRIYEYAATEFSALADKTEKTVTVSGTLLSKYAGQTVTVYETSVKNYNELLSYSGNVKIAEGKANANGEFDIEFPLERENGMTHLSTIFLAEVNGVKLNKSFMIENWRDFSENPYAFTLNALAVDVTTSPYLAKGDGFTNDNAAIQAAIDYVSAQGGGTVILPGDTENPYGRRYMITHLSLKSNVELRISEGAVLWQSPRLEDYDYGGYSPVYGHDIYIPGTPWTHAGACWNPPLIYAYNVKNVRVTGGGEIRSMDTGTQWLDGEWGESELSVNCGNIIHSCTFASSHCENVEVTDITTKRGNIWHMPNVNGKNLFFGNVHMTEISCINSDGISFTKGTSNVCETRCTLYGNDDALVLSACYDDPRGHTDHSWEKLDEPDPEKPHGVENVVITYCNLYGGHGLTFIPWGSNAPVEDNAEISNIRATDNVFGGYTTAVGCWTDNPFHGESWIEGLGVAGTFTEREKDDYSSIKNVYLMNNKYDGACVMGTWPSGAPEYATPTNFISDCGIYSSSVFLNGSFDKRIKYVTEKTWESRLAYWSSEVEQNGEVGVEKTGTKLTPVIGTDDEIEINDHAGFVKGNGKLYQGLYNIFGKYEFSAKVKLVSGSAKLFVRDAISGKTLAEKAISSSEEFQTIAVDYSLEKSATLYIGIEHTGEATELVYIDDAVLAYEKDPALFEVQGVEYDYDFADNNGLVAYNPKGAPVSARYGALTMPADAEYKVVLEQAGKLKEFDMSVDIIMTDGLKVDCGMYFAVGTVGYAADKIDAYNVQVTRKPEESDKLYIDLFEFSAAKGYVGTLKGAAIELPERHDKVTLRVVVKSDIMFVFVNSAEDFALMYELPDGYEGGNVGFRSQYALSRMENFTIKTAEFAEMPGNRTELDKLLAVATKFAASAYTKESFAALTSAISAANGLTAASTQREIDEVKKSLDWAIERLAEAPATTPEPPEPQVKIEYVTQTVTEKNTGMTVGFYVVLGLLIAFIGAGTGAAIYFVKKNKNKKTEE